MARVVLIPTGKMEHAALADALNRLFPDDDFIPQPKENHLDGFTSTDVAHIKKLGGSIPTNVEELAAALVASVAPGKQGKPAEFAFVVEDLELANDHQPDRVIQVFRDAVEHHICKTWPGKSQDRNFALVKERCSFHLFRPMTEAYFFGEPAALQRAGAIQSP